MVEIPIVCLDHPICEQPCVCECVFVIEDVWTRASVHTFAHNPRASMCVFLKGGALSRVWMKYGSHLALCPHSSLPDGPVPLTLSPWPFGQTKVGGSSWAEG